MDLHSGLPYWVVKNSLLDYFHPLEDDFSTDIVVVGSGITGALMVHELCSAGLRCCMVDKRSIATGSSIASTALLQYEIDVPLCEMAEIIGEDNAVSAYRASLASIADIEKVLKETGVDADFEKRPSLFYASIPKDIELIEKEYVIRKKHNLPVRLLGKEEIKKLYNIEVPGNALLNRVSAQMDAYKATTGLLLYHMKKDGLEIFTHTGVTECVEMPEGYIIETDRGHKIECKYVIIASGFEAGKFLSREIMDLTSTYALVSHPVDSKDLCQNGPIETGASRAKEMSPRAYNLAMSALIFLGFCAMGAGAYFTSTMAFARMMMSGAALPLVFGSFILTIVGIVMMSAAAGKQSVGLSLVGYVIFASTFGLTASFGLANYDLPTINTAFIATAAITFVFGALGVTFPKFFQRVYGIGFGILLATILVEIVLMFMGVSQTITDLIVIVVFAGFIGYDTYVATTVPPTLPNAVLMASNLFVDIINVFLRILNILGRRD